MNLKILKLQQGGSFYTDYIPAITPTAPTTPTTPASTAGVSLDKESALLDKKELEILYEKGLPSDVEALTEVLARFENDIVSGNKMSSYRLIGELNKVKFQKQKFEEATKTIEGRDALASVAVTGSGQLYTVSKDNGIQLKNISDYNPAEDRVMTIQEVMSTRAYNRNNAGSLSYQDVAVNSSSMEDIRKTLTEAIKNVLNTTQSLTQELAEAQLSIKSIQLGKEVSAPQTELALSYLMATLPPRLMNYLKLLARRLGYEDLQEGVQLIIKTGILQGNKHLVDDTYREKPATDKSSGSGSGSGSKGGTTPLSFSSKVQRMEGVLEQVSINPETLYEMIMQGVSHNALVDNKNLTAVAAGTPVTTAIEQSLPGVADLSSASIGGNRISPEKLVNMVYRGGKTATVFLPLDGEELKKGNRVPDLDMMKRREEADKEVKRLGLNKEEAEAYYAKNNIILKSRDVSVDPRFGAFITIPIVGHEDDVDPTNNSMYLQKFGTAKDTNAFLNSQRDLYNKIKYGEGFTWFNINHDYNYSADLFVPISRHASLNVGSTVPLNQMDLDTQYNQEAARRKDNEVAERAEKYKDVKVKSSELLQ